MYEPVVRAGDINVMGKTKTDVEAVDTPEYRFHGLGRGILAKRQPTATIIAIRLAFETRLSSVAPMPSTARDAVGKVEISSRPSLSTWMGAYQQFQGRTSSQKMEGARCR